MEHDGIRRTSSPFSSSCKFATKKYPYEWSSIYIAVRIVPQHIGLNLLNLVWKSFESVWQLATGNWQLFEIVLNLYAFGLNKFGFVGFVQKQ